MKQIKIYLPSIILKFRNLILYGIIGSFSAGVDFIAFYLLTTFGKVYYLYANIFSVTLGITISFTLNRHFNFKVKDKVFRRFVIFATIGFSGLLLSSFLLFFFIDVMVMNRIISKLLSIVFVVLIQFLLNKFITFRKEE